MNSLLDLGVDANPTFGDNKTFIAVATQGSYLNTICLLLKRGARARFRCSDAYCEAAGIVNIELLKLLSPSDTDKEGDSIFNEEILAITKCSWILVERKHRICRP